MYRSSSLILFFLVLISLSTSAQQHPLSQGQKTALDQLLVSLAESDPGVAIAIVSKGQLIYKNGKGRANLNHGTPINTQTRFQVAELGNQFIAFGALLLADQGQLDLNAEVHQYLPELPEFGSSISVRSLMSHTNGLPSYVELLSAAGWPMADWKTRPQVLQVLKSQQSLLFAPGDDMDHSLTGFVLLAEIIQRVSGKSFSDYMQEHVFDPLKMKATAFVDNPSEIIPDAAPTYYQVGNTWYEGSFGYFKMDATNLRTSVEDMALWIQNRQNPKVGTPKIMSMMGSPVKLNNGEAAASTLGQFLETFRGRPGLYQTGMAYGRISCLLHFPEKNFGVVVLSNFDTYNTQQLAMQAAEICVENYFESPPEGVMASSSSSRPAFKKLSNSTLKKYCGDYWNAESFYARKIYLKADTLRYSRGPGNESNLIPVSDDRFYMLDQPEEVYISFNKEQMIFSIQDYQYTSEKFTPAAYNTSALSAYEGFYFSKELGAIYQIIQQDGQLLAKHSRTGDILLSALDQGRFSGNAWHFGLIEFEYDPKGKKVISGFKLSAEGFRPIDFQKLSDL